MSVWSAAQFPPSREHAVSRLSSEFFAMCRHGSGQSTVLCKTDRYVFGGNFRRDEHNFFGKDRKQKVKVGFTHF